MKRGRSFLLLLVIAAGIGAYVWFVEMKRDPNATEEAPREKIFTVDTTQIQEVRLKNEAGEESTLKKTGDRWTIAEVPGAEVDETAAGNIVTALATLESSRVVDERPAALGEYGLQTPRITASFKDASGTERSIMIGSKTATGGDLYARTGDSPRVFLVGSFLEETFNRSRFDLRDKRALKFARDAVGSISITNAGGAFVLTRANGAWRITAPADEVADETAVESLISRLSAAQMQSIIDAPDASKTGLAKPVATVALSAGPQRAEVEIGAPADEGSVYARDTQRGIVFTIESSLADELKKKVDEFRKKTQ